MDATTAAVDRALGDAVVASRARATTSVSDANPDGWSRSAPGVSASFSGSRLATLNGVFVSDEAAEVAEVEAMLDELAATGLPYSLQLRRGLPAALAPVVERHGLALEAVLPLMVVGPDAFTPAPVPADLRIETVRPEAAEPHLRLAGLGLEIPLEDLETFLTPALLGSPDWTTYLGTVDGQVAVTAAALVTGDHVGLMSIVTEPAFRGRGFAAAITSQAVARAFDAGIVRAYLQSSQAGYRVYERLGFREVEKWHIWA